MRQFRTQSSSTDVRPTLAGRTCATAPRGAAGVAEQVVAFEHRAVEPLQPFRRRRPEVGPREHRSPLVASLHPDRDGRSVLRARPQRARIPLQGDFDAQLLRERGDGFLECPLSPPMIFSGDVISPKFHRALRERAFIT